MKNITKIIMALVIGSTIFGCVDTKKSNLDTLISTEWRLDSVVTEIVGAPLAEESMVTISFSDSTGFSGNGGCNPYFGTFTTEGDDVIAISPKGRAMMMCPNLAFEDSYIAALAVVTKFVAAEDQLVMSNANGDAVLIFVPAEKEENL